jgi:chromosome segregation ATPase
VAGPGTTGGEPGAGFSHGVGQGGAGQPRGDWNWSNQLDRIEQKVDGLNSVVGGLNAKLNKVLGQELSIQHKESQIMADVKIAQETLDADGDALTKLAADLQSLLESGNLSEADQTKLQNGIDALTALDTLNVTPPAPSS